MREYESWSTCDTRPEETKTEVTERIRKTPTSSCEMADEWEKRRRWMDGGKRMMEEEEKERRLRDERWRSR